MSNACKVLVSIHDKTSGYTNLLVYDTMDAAKRDFEAQLERFREKDRGDFKLCYYGMFDTEHGAIIYPSDDGTDQYAIFAYTSLLYGDIPEFARTPVKMIEKGVEKEYLHPYAKPMFIPKNSVESEDDKPW